jgi:hypothetical protein
MPKKILQVVVFFAVLGLLFFAGCKTNGDAGQYTLSVTVAQGISGTPAAGSTSYADGDTVNYNYSLQAGYENLDVKLDGVTVASSGVITMDQNHTLTVTADEKFNPTGKWTGYLYYIPDLYADITFSGDYTSGTVTGDIDFISGTGNGTYSISGNSINIVLHYGGGNVYLTGTIEDNDHMSGDWSVDPGTIHGNFELTRQ